MPSVRFIPPPPGSTIRKPGFADTFLGLTKGYDSFKQTRESRLKTALERMLTRGELTGDYGELSPTETAALRSLTGIEDPSQINATALGRKVAAVKQVSPEIEGLSRIEQQLLGIKSPVEQTLKLEKQRQEMAKSAGVEDLPPTRAYQSLYEESTGQAYPRVQVINPETGEMEEQPAPYKLFPDKEQAKVQKALGSAKVAADTNAPVFGDSPDEVSMQRRRSFGEQKMLSTLGLNWRETYPKAAIEFDQLLPDPTDPATQQDLIEQLKQRAFAGDREAYLELERRFPQLFE